MASLLLAFPKQWLQAKSIWGKGKWPNCATKLFSGRDAVSDPLTDLLRKGARQLLQRAVEAEPEGFLARFSEHSTPDGRSVVVRNRTSPGARRANRNWPGHGSGSQSALEDGHPEATGFSATTVARLKTQWAAEYDTWRKADLGRDEWVYIRADGIYSRVRSSDDRLCALVVDRGECPWREAFSRNRRRCAGK